MTNQNKTQFCVIKSSYNFKVLKGLKLDDFFIRNVRIKKRCTTSKQLFLLTFCAVNHTQYLPDKSLNITGDSLQGGKVECSTNVNEYQTSTRGPLTQVFIKSYSSLTPTLLSGV